MMVLKFLRVFAIILSAGFIMLSGCRRAQVPAVLFDGEMYKFGEVKAGEDVVFTFYFSNPGQSELRLTNLYISCDCVVIKEYDTQVKPGSKGKIYGVIKTTELRGEVTRAIRVETNVPGADPVVLNLEGSVIAQ